MDMVGDSILEPRCKRGSVSVRSEEQPEICFDSLEFCINERDSPEFWAGHGKVIDEALNYALDYPGLNECLENTIQRYDLAVTLATDKLCDLAFYR